MSSFVCFSICENYCTLSAAGWESFKFFTVLLMDRSSLGLYLLIKAYRSVNGGASCAPLTTYTCIIIGSFAGAVLVSVLIPPSVSVTAISVICVYPFSSSLFRNMQIVLVDFI